jgi:hypothetical protein
MTEVCKQVQLCVSGYEHKELGRKASATLLANGRNVTLTLSAMRATTEVPPTISAQIFQSDVLPSTSTQILGMFCESVSVMPSRPASCSAKSKQLMQAQRCNSSCVN